MKHPIALITGATAGIGKSIAKKMAEAGYALILTGRRKERLDQTVSGIREGFGVPVIGLNFDVRDSTAVNTSISNLPEEWTAIEVLVNNAGLAAGLGPVHAGDIEDWDRMIDTNIKGVLYMLRAVSPGMINRKKGHIINISSIASREVYPMGNVYCATKHALDVLTRSMRMELVDIPIKISSIHPGMVETEFSLVRFRGDEARARAVYEDYEPLMADDVANTVMYCINQPAHVNIHELTVMPSGQAAVRLMRKKH
jgi:3-hydroxy acid dehydrogenase / malonic semialdehyde reductase